MTRYEKSDAQLDAEAEARRRKLDPPRQEHGLDDPDAHDVPAFQPSPPPSRANVSGELRWLIVELRRALMMETPDKLHQRQTSHSPDDELDARGWPKDTDEGGLGPPLSARMHRFLRTNAGPSKKHPWDRGPDARVRPAMASIIEVSGWCAARHTSHLRPLHTRTLCSQMVFEAGYLGQEPSDLAWLHGLELEQVELMLVAALRKAREWRIDAETKLSREPGTVEPMPERRPFRPAA